MREFGVEILGLELLGVVVGHGEHLEHVGDLHQVVAHHRADLHVGDDAVRLRVAYGRAYVQHHDEIAAQLASNLFVCVF